MYIFIDESGSFAPPQRGHSVCCVAALTVPDSRLGTVLDGFGGMVADWGLSGREPKGSALGERKLDRLVTLLGNNDVVLTVVATDMGMTIPAAIAEHRRAQAEKILTSADGPEHLPSMRESVRELAWRLENLSDPLYLECMMLTLLLHDTVQTTTLHYAQTEPHALASFVWRIDAKDRAMTEYERLWVDVVKPFMQTTSLHEPLVTVRGGNFDYSAMARFENPTLQEVPAHLMHGRPDGAQGPFHSLDLRKIVDADLRFGDSRSDRGLQVADVLANAFRRACNGRLGYRGWRRLGQLMVKRLRDGQAVNWALLMAGGRGRMSLRGTPYWGVARSFEEQARPMLVSG